MARKRMFDMEIVDTDLFLDMPQSSQNLYFHLGMRADDDGFVSNPKKIIKIIGASEDDLKLLFLKKFIIPFESGVCVITHWKLNNYLRKDRYTETIYKTEKRMLNEDENGVYSIGIPNGNQLSTTGIHSIEENSIDKNSIEENSKEEKENASNDDRKRFVPPTLDEVKKYCIERGNNIDAEQFVDYYTTNGWKVGKNKMKDWKASVRTWERNGYSNKNTNNNYNFIDVAIEMEEQGW